MRVKVDAVAQARWRHGQHERVGERAPRPLLVSSGSRAARASWRGCRRRRSGPGWRIRSWTEMRQPGLAVGGAELHRAAMDGICEAPWLRGEGEERGEWKENGEGRGTRTLAARFGPRQEKEGPRGPGARWRSKERGRAARDPPGSSRGSGLGACGHRDEEAGTRGRRRTRTLSSTGDRRWIHRRRRRHGGRSKQEELPLDPRSSEQGGSRAWSRWSKGCRVAVAGWIEGVSEFRQVAALAGGGRNQGAGRSDLVGWMGTLRWVAAGSGGIPRKGVAAAGRI